MQNFLQKSELNTVLPISLADAITNQDDSIVSQIISESIALMSSYLSKFYDVQAIFSASGSQRNLTVLKYLKDIVAFEIIRAHTHDTANESAQQRYDTAIQWLRDLNTGTLSDSTLPPLPIQPDSDPATSGNVRFGTSAKYSSIY